MRNIRKLIIGLTVFQILCALLIYLTYTYKDSSTAVATNGDAMLGALVLAGLLALLYMAIWVINLIISLIYLNDERKKNNKVDYLVIELNILTIILAAAAIFRDYS